MINYHKGDMFKLLDDPDYRGLFLVTTNGYLKKNGELVMGRGAALQLKNKYKFVPYLFGGHIRANYLMGRDSYYIVYDSVVLSFSIGAFQVKFGWKEPASLYLIEKSAKYLNEIAPNFSRVDLNFPGIGNGQLDKMQVLPILGSELTNNNIHIWEL